MAHDIFITATGRASMAFVGETPWHGLGQQLTQGASIEQWTIEAGFAWQAVTAAVQFTDDLATLQTMPGQRVIFRSDTRAPLSVVSDGYQIVQPAEIMEFMRTVTEDNGFHMETAGVLQGGRRLWALARNGHEGEVVPGDKVRQRLLLATSMDGSMKTVASFVQERVVCANTLRVAMREADTARRGDARKAAGPRSYVATSHRSEFDAASVRQQMGLADAAWAQFLTDARTLADKGCSTEQARDILRDVFGQPTARASAKAQTIAAAAIAKAAAPAGDSFAALLARPLAPLADLEAEGRADLTRMMGGQVVREQRSVARCLDLFGGAGRGSDHAGVKGTMWGLLNAVTEHVDHELGRTDDSRLNSAWFGRGDGFKQSALQTMLATAGA